MKSAASELHNVHEMITKTETIKRQRQKVKGSAHGAPNVSPSCNVHTTGVTVPNILHDGFQFNFAIINKNRFDESRNLRKLVSSK